MKNAAAPRRAARAHRFAGWCSRIEIHVGIQIAPWIFDSRKAARTAATLGSTSATDARAFVLVDSLTWAGAGSARPGQRLESAHCRNVTTGTGPPRYPKKRMPHTPSVATSSADASSVALRDESQSLGLLTKRGPRT